jgi:hypothetical protein
VKKPLKWEGMQKGENDFVLPLLAIDWMGLATV